MEDEIKKEILEGEENKEEEGAPTEPAENSNENNVTDSPADDTSTLENSENPETENEIVNDFHVDAVKDEFTPPMAENEPIGENKSSESVPSENDLVEENGAVDTSIKTFTQEDVDKLVGDTRVRTREKTFRYIYDRYGVKNEEELDGLIANAQRYDTQKEMYESDKANWETEKSESDKRLNDMSEQIALMQSEISPDRYEDAKLILKGKGLEVNLENISAELATHPEWKKEEAKVEEAKAAPEKPTMRIRALGNEQRPAPEVSEEEQAQKLFKMKW